MYTVGFIVRVSFAERGVQHLSNPPCGIAEVLDFLGVQRASKNVAFTVRKPFLTAPQNPPQTALAVSTKLSGSPVSLGPCPLTVPPSA